jgi:hypothetical protein
VVDTTILVSLCASAEPFSTGLGLLALISSGIEGAAPALPALAQPLHLAILVLDW